MKNERKVLQKRKASIADVAKLGDAGCFEKVVKSTLGEEV
jgi:hypothetical protein